MGPEGELRIALRLQGGLVQGADIHSTRPDVAGTMLQGRTRVEVGAVVPLLFSICGRSQAAASALACAAAAGQMPSADDIERHRRAVAAETVREGAWRTLLDWPQWLDEKPGDDAVAAARASLAWLAADPAATGEQNRAAAAAIAMAAFGMPAPDWLAIDDVAGLASWAQAGRTAAARFVCLVRDDEAAAQAQVRSTAAVVPLLADRQHADWVGPIAQAAAADPDFVRHPTWHGAPAETGALARQQSDPLLAELAARAASRPQARFVARLRELALLLAGRAEPALGAIAVPGAGGVAWVETARGLLIHQVALQHGHVHRYRIVAPTEWNFHPQGALALALVGASAADAAAARHGATRLVHSLDPCVACRVEVSDA